MHIKLNHWFQCIDHKILFEYRFSNDKFMERKESAEGFNPSSNEAPRRNELSVELHHQDEGETRGRSGLEMVSNLSRTSFTKLKKRQGSMT